MNDLIVYLLAMVVVVPLSKRFGLGAVIGYIVAGALIGQQGFSLLHAREGTSELAEFGVIMMLLLIGLTIQHGMSRLDCVTPTEDQKPDLVDESEKDNPVLVVGI